MSVAAAITLLLAVLVLIEVLNIFLGLWSDRLSDRLRGIRQRPRPRFPWSDRTGT